MVWTVLLLAILLFGAIYYLTLPVAEVEKVQRGAAISAVYGTVRIEPAFVIPIRAQNAGYIQLTEPLSAGRGAIGQSVQKGELLATIADETTARQLKQARADLQAENERAKLDLPSAEPLKLAEANVQRLEKLTALSNVPAADYEKAKSEANRLRDAVKAEQIERDRNLETLTGAVKKLEAQMKNSEIRSSMDGILSDIKIIDGELVTEGNQLFTVSSRRNYVRGEVNEEDVGEVKMGMKAEVQLYAYRTRQLSAKVSSIWPAADPDTQRYTIVLDLQNAPENLMAGMTGEMNIITGTHENVLLLPARALLVDQALIVKNNIIQKRTIRVGYRTLEYAEAISGVSEREHVVVSDQDKLRPGRLVRQRMVSSPRNTGK
ncbi:MAG: efflux RND transporter periplasmic adaptor subunit [Verrucomicrobiota bacterium]|nr:efflux RND transporter periplasmic adaptor subunit [Verrucomicrobiota bacterium]